jgi:hypothetical protein
MWEKKGNIFSKHWAQLPVVDTSYEDFWRIFYSQRMDNKSYPMFIDVKKDNPTEIINESQSPIIVLGELGTFDQAGVMPTEIINYNNKKYLYYIGWSNRKDVPYFNTIGLAISEDEGKTFKKFSTGPVFGSSYKEPGYTGTIKIMIENNIWRAWYLSCRKWQEINGIVEPFYDIKYAESTNGIDWEPHNKTCIHMDEDFAGISQASVLKIENKYHMWFSARKKTDYRTNPNNSYRIYKAISHNGIDWEYDKTPSLDVSETGWDSTMVEYPYVIFDKQSYYMFYTGNGFGKEGIGYAKIKK